MEQNPYAPSPICATSAGGAGHEDALSREEIEAYAGKNGRVYWDLLQSAARAPTLFAGFNVAAAAFMVPWLLYRKMVRECLAMLGLTSILWSVLGVISALRPTVGSLFGPVHLAVAATTGLLGNGLYLRRMRSARDRIWRSERDPSRRLHLLARRGGTSWFAPILFMVLAIAFYVVSTAWKGPA
jgi:hypothetical protein